MALPLVIASHAGWTTARAQTPEIVVAGEVGSLASGQMGGTWQSALYPPGYAGATFRPLPAAGRSFDTGFSVKF